MRQTLFKVNVFPNLNSLQKNFLMNLLRAILILSLLGISPSCQRMTGHCQGQEEKGSSPWRKVKSLLLTNNRAELGRFWTKESSALRTTPLKEGHHKQRSGRSPEVGKIFPFKWQLQYKPLLLECRSILSIPPPETKNKRNEIYMKELE